jgi:NAD(P)-dependent dehydrogenase (short-subunit alcohol dehydrogenase family)
MIDFHGNVVIVTGAAQGLGRSYALEFARRGASVVANDFGGTVEGAGPSEAPADQVVAEIEAAGGVAVASYDSVATQDGGEQLVATALDSFGRIDAVVNNAGVLRNEQFATMSHEKFAGVLRTHLFGAFHVSQPAYRVMQEQRYGRFVFTSSGSGLFGSRNQVNYASAKAGIVGLSRAIGTEGERHGVRSNVVSPMAQTRMARAMTTDDMTEEDMRMAMRGPDREHPSGPEFVTPLVVYLASENCTANRRIFSASGGRFAEVFVAATRGWYGPTDRPASAEDVGDHFAEVGDRSVYAVPASVYDEVGCIREMDPGAPIRLGRT